MPLGLANVEGDGNSYMSYSLTSFKGLCGLCGNYLGAYYEGYLGDTRSLDPNLNLKLGVMKGDTRSLDYSSHYYWAKYDDLA